MTQDRVSIDSKVMGGKPVIRNTRVTVEQIVRECARGLTVTEIVSQYPKLQPEDVSAALQFAADYLAAEITTAAE